MIFSLDILLFWEGEREREREIKEEEEREKKGGGGGEVLNFIKMQFDFTCSHD